jgi:DNA-binding GntR family transcriptional regulator
MPETTLREVVADKLRRAIVDGSLKPGTRLQEIEIAKRYEASRTPVREALRQLESEGFLLIRARRGAVVAPVTTRDVEEFYEIKEVLEGYAAERAAKQITSEELELMTKLNALLKERYEEHDISGMLECHNQFHQIFVKACGNRRLYLMLDGLITQFQRFRIALSHTDAVRDFVVQHEQIIEALRARDALRAKELVAENARQGKQRLLKRLAEGQAEFQV